MKYKNVSLLHNNVYWELSNLASNSDSQRSYSVHSTTKNGVTDRIRENDLNLYLSNSKCPLLTLASLLHGFENAFSTSLNLRQIVLPIFQKKLENNSC